MVSRYWVGGGLAEGVCSGGFGLSADIGRKGCIRICVRCGYFGGGGGGLVQQARNGCVELGPNPFGASLASGCGGSGGQGGARHRHVVGEVRAAGGAFRSQRRKPSAGSLGAHRSSCLGDRVGGVGCVGERTDNAPCLARFTQSRSATPLSSKSEPKGPSRPNPSQETMLSPVVGLFRGFSQSSPDAAEVQFRISGHIGLLGRLSCPTKTA